MTAKDHYTKEVLENQILDTMKNEMQIDPRHAAHLQSSLVPHNDPLRPTTAALAAATLVTTVSST